VMPKQSSQPEEVVALSAMKRMGSEKPVVGSALGTKPSGGREVSQKWMPLIRR
jgi:hypothetical protein